MYAPPHPPGLSNSNSRTSVADVPSLRAYQVWKGSNRFCCGGRLIFGPDARSLYMTIFLILVPVFLFCTFVSRTLIEEFHHRTGNIIVVICAVFTVYTIALLFLTSGRDPGIIPRNQQPPDPEDEAEGSVVSSDWPGSLGVAPSIPPTKDVKVNGVTIKVKYCQTCMLYRPPRCSHCSICNNCVDRFDHHCPWVGQCIGKRNYRFFFMFISSTTLLCLYVFVFSIVNLSKIMSTHHCSLWKALSKSPASGILILYTFLVAWFVGGLTGFHLYLILTNQTTYENFRYRYDRRMNPYNRGWAGNALEIFCSRIPPSRNNFREKVEVDPAEIFNNSVSYMHAMNPELPKISFDFGMGKRQAVAAEDFADAQNQLEGIGGLERCGTQPPRLAWETKDNWEMNLDRMLAPEFGVQYGMSPKELQKINDVHHSVPPLQI
ncbi:hypothetical protein SAY86_009030 [Trapa natans]|uniref:S-acyltransferase n=1 Tax=Trapa natans TaxID=22666 RepID=A0AAN7QBZ5_TRANT|nr:hypothetical protein SAY86_009030 [Trapa natans]